MKILGVGEAVVDKNTVVDGDDRRHGTTQFDAGGPVLAALLLLSKLGAQCDMVASLGPDQPGDFIKKLLRDEKISLVVHERHATKQNVILVDSVTGQRQKIRGEVTHAPLKGLTQEYVRAFDLIIIDRHEQKAFYEIVGHIDDTTQLIVDPSTEVSDFTKDMMRHSTCPIIPIESLAELGGGQDLQRSLEIGYAICGKPYVVTLGEYGSLLYDGTMIELVPPLDVAAVDTLGAGDIYRGAFAYGRLQNWSMGACATYANTVAGLQCTRRGNAMAVPSSEVIARGMATSARRHVPLATIEMYFASLVPAKVA